jgi:hypothetical protein
MSHEAGETLDGQVEFHFKRLGRTGSTLVVVVVGGRAYGACASEPLAALHAAAWSASEDFANRGQHVDPDVLMEWGEEELRKTSSTVDGAEPSAARGRRRTIRASLRFNA